MKVVRVEVSVECDDGVSEEIVTGLLRLHMAICFHETRGGDIDWPQMRARVIRGQE